MKLSASTLLLLTSLMWLAMAGDYTKYAAGKGQPEYAEYMELREKAVNSAAIFHDLWLGASGIA